MRAFASLALSIALVLCRAAAAEACPADEALDAVAVDVLLGEAASSSPEGLRRALAERGSSAIEAYVFTVRGDDELRASLARLEARLGVPLRCGEALSDSARITVAVPDAATLWLEGGRVHGRLRPGFDGAHLVYRWEGEAVRVAVDAVLLARGVALPAEVLARRPEVQLVAETPHGPRPLARLPGPLPETARFAGVKDPTELVLAVRAAASAPSVRINALLAREAKEHAAKICASRHASHDGIFGDPEARLLARGISARVVGEAVARARTLAEALEALLESPSHRAALEDRRFSDLGVGVAKHGESTCVVAILAAFPRAVPPSRPPHESLK